MTDMAPPEQEDRGDAQSQQALTRHDATNQTHSDAAIQRPGYLGSNNVSVGSGHQWNGNYIVNLNLCVHPVSLCAIIMMLVLLTMLYLTMLYLTMLYLTKMP